MQRLKNTGEAILVIVIIAAMFASYIYIGTAIGELLRKALEGC